MGQTRSNSSTGGTARTPLGPADVPPFLRKLLFPLAIVDQYAAPRAVLPTETLCFGGNRRYIGRKRQRAPLTILAKSCRFPGRDYQTSLDWGSACSSSRAPQRPREIHRHKPKSYRTHKSDSCAPWTSAIRSTWKRGTSVLFIFRNSFVIPSLSGFSANKKLRIWADSFRLARDSDAIQ